MCKQCEANPVYKFTNKRELCKNCFIHWFQKKFLYTIRKFKMISKGDVILFKNTRSFRDVVLDDLLKIYSERGIVEIIKIRSQKLIATNRTKSRFSTEELLSHKNYSGDNLILNDIISSSKKSRAKRDNFPTKIAISSTTDSEANEIIHILIKGSVSKLKQSPVENIDGKIIIKPLYLFLDKEVLLYAKLKKLKFRNIKEKNTENKKFSVLKTSKGYQEVSKDKINLFLDDLEKKHPEVKQSVISSYLELFR